MATLLPQKLQQSFYQKLQHSPADTSIMAEELNDENKCNSN
ncbi:unnamed protein product [Arabidopsis halleri]